MAITVISGRCRPLSVALGRRGAPTVPRAFSRACQGGSSGVRFTIPATMMVRGGYADARILRVDSLTKRDADPGRSVSGAWCAGNSSGPAIIGGLWRYERTLT